MPRTAITPSWKRWILAQQLGDPLSGGASLVADSWLCTVPVPRLQLSFWLCVEGLNVLVVAMTSKLKTPLDDVSDRR